MTAEEDKVEELSRNVDLAYVKVEQARAAAAQAEAEWYAANEAYAEHVSAVVRRQRGEHVSANA